MNQLPIMLPTEYIPWAYNIVSTTQCFLNEHKISLFSKITSYLCCKLLYLCCNVCTLKVAAHLRCFTYSVNTKARNKISTIYFIQQCYVSLVFSRVYPGSKRMNNKIHAVGNVTQLYTTLRLLVILQDSLWLVILQLPMACLILCTQLLYTFVYLYNPLQTPQHGEFLQKSLLQVVLITSLVDFGTPYWKMRYCWPLCKWARILYTTCTVRWYLKIIL